ncbi:MAG TPA: Asp23/Gls24 family envelope stress response protein [Clostridia bacterium]|nr:Asp23/Gls24 family envelope stress response protein [Clostridia bacterium]
MKIYALVGSSGTGKSYKASNLANSRGIQYIIDDGLLIKGSKVMAGMSAKREATMIAAVRRALFMHKEHASKVSKTIEELEPESILVLGTSDNMIKRILNNLNLSAAAEIIRIEDIASKEDIARARSIRKEQGKHVIPVPTFEIRKDFSGYFLHPLRIFRRTEKGRRIETLEKTVMRPTFSYMGNFFIADLAIESIATYNANLVEGVYKVAKTTMLSHDEGVVIDIEITVIYGYKIHLIMEEIQENILLDIIDLTGINVLQVNVITKGIVRV